MIERALWWTLTQDWLDFTIWQIKAASHSELIVEYISQVVISKIIQSKFLKNCKHNWQTANFTL